MPGARVWAPWRIHYILGPKGDNCPFCVAREQEPTAESLVLVTWPRTYVILNRYPYTGCHLMVLPREHASSLSALSPGVYTEMMELVRISAERLQLAVRPDGINMGMNLGKAAGAGIDDHIHMHLVPRWNGDTSFMAVVGETHVVSQGLEHAWTSLRPHFEDLDRS